MLLVTTSQARTVPTESSETCPIQHKIKKNELQKHLGKTAQKASWNKMGVEPGNQEGPGCYDLGVFWY